ncbi:alpha/beta fold hydrolase [Dermacoccaceae bacterium W4C1]
MSARTAHTATDVAEPTRPPEQWATVEGVKVRWVDHPGPGGDRPVFVLVHGLGGSLTNWDWLAPLLAEHGRVIALDLGGFGLTEVGAEAASVEANRRLLGGFLRALDLPPVILVGNSMGGMVAAYQGHEDPSTVSGVVLIDPALPLHPRHRAHPLVLLGFGIYMVPPLGRRFLDERAKRLPVEQMATESIALVVAHMSKVPDWLLRHHIREATVRAEQVAAAPSTTFLPAARSVVTTSARRSYAKVLDTLPGPVLLIHGDQDKLVNVGSARSLAARHPEWAYAEGEDLGHCPMFEDAPWVRDQILAWAGERGLLTAASR